MNGLYLICILITLGGLKPLYASDTGKSAAMKYFTNESESKTRQPQSTSSHSESYKNVISLSLGTLISSKSYQWGEESKEGWNIEGSYLKQGNYFARGFHLEYQRYNEQEQEELSKLSLLISFTFPARVTFPVYLAVAAGPGFFLKQRKDESEFALDYKAYLGLRLNQNHSQYFIQSGVKNHVNMLSDGQFIGWFVSSGVAYKF